MAPTAKQELGVRPLPELPSGAGLLLTKSQNC